MSTYYNTCEYCGSNLDPGESCTCGEHGTLEKSDPEKEDAA